METLKPTEAYKMIGVVKDAGAHVEHNSGNNEWNTPKTYTEAARTVMGSIDVDPASSEAANKTVRAAEYYTKEDDGLSHEWHGAVWMNPPYSGGLVDDFSKKLVSEYQNGAVTQACVLVNNATETEWLQRMFLIASAVCFPRQRIRFIGSDGEGANTPLQGQAVLYFGDNTQRFIDAFREFGFVVVPSG